MEFLVRTGVFGDLDWYVPIDGRSYSRDAEVICRTPRGLELGVVMSNRPAAESPTARGRILRPVNTNDQLLIERLARYRDRAFVACEQLLKQRQLPDVLVDVEQLFDGEHLFFYFLGPIGDALQEVLDDLASTYESKIRFRQFAERVAEGCGPGCGTVDRGCTSSGGCATCAAGGGCAAAGLKRSALSHGDRDRNADAIGL